MAPDYIGDGLHTMVGPVRVLWLIKQLQEKTNGPFDAFFITDYWLCKQEHL